MVTRQGQVTRDQRVRTANINAQARLVNGHERAVIASGQCKAKPRSLIPKSLVPYD